MIAFRSALLAFLSVQATNAFTTPSLSSIGGSRRQSSEVIITQSFLGGFDLATLEVEQVQLLEVAGAALASVVAVAGGFALKGNMQQPKTKTTTVVADEEMEPEPVDVSIPYHAAAAIAFEAWLQEDTNSRVNDKATYLKFETLYENMAVAQVIQKKYQQQVDKYQGDIDQYLSEMASLAPPSPTVVDVLIPYDAAAKLAYEASDKSMTFEDFKVKYEADAVALVKSKQQTA